MDIRAVLVAMFLVLLAGCGSSTNAPVPAPPAIATKPDVTITFDGERHTCVVALASEAQGSAVSCSEVVQFVRDELRLPSGSIYDIRTIPGINKTEIAGVGTRLNAAGYRFIGGH
jgi:type IV pilus biogenesis protein CpaD/CtpE